jgi:hypothetical protein
MRVSDQKRAELGSFWRANHEGWQASDLNQREYRELHGLPLKRFGNRRAQFKDEETVAQLKLLWRRGGGLRHVSGHMSDREIEPVSKGNVPSAKSLPDGRRNFRTADKKRICAEYDMIVKVKEPQTEDRTRWREGQILLAYLHLAPDPEQTADLVESGVTAIAYETVTGTGRTPSLLKPMSQVAGRMSVQAGAMPGKVVIIGGGVVGFNTA